MYMYVYVCTYRSSIRLMHTGWYVWKIKMKIILDLLFLHLAHLITVVVVCLLPNALVVHVKNKNNKLNIAEISKKNCKAKSEAK